MRLNWEIEFYVDENGISNVKKFLDGILDKKMKAKVLRDIGLLELMGTELSLPHTRYLEDGIWELRTKQSTNICRILYFSFLNGKLVLLSGFIKKTMKTPRSEIVNAKKNRDDYIRRYKHEV